MAKFNLIRAFKNAIQDLGRCFYDGRDCMTLTDEFAKAAFRNKGYQVVERQRATEFSNEAVGSGIEAKYILRKIQKGKEAADQQQYIGTIESGFLMTPETCMFRQYRVSDIQPFQPPKP